MISLINHRFFMSGFNQFITRFGQRNFAKFLFLITFFIAFLGFFKIKLNTTLTFVEYFTQPLVFLGIFLFSFPSLMLSITATQTRAFRFYCIYASMIFFISNTILFFGNFYDFLYPITIFQCVCSSLFFIFVLWYEKKNDQKTKKTRTVTRVTSEKKPSGLKIKG